LRIIDGESIGHTSWGTQVVEAAYGEEFDVKGISINEILRQSGFGQIDILKMNIEGSERFVFETEADYREWLDKTRNIVMDYTIGLTRDARMCFMARWQSIFMISPRKIILNIALISGRKIL